MKKAPLIVPDFNLNRRFHVCNTPKGYKASLGEHKQGNTICAPSHPRDRTLVPPRKKHVHSSEAPILPTATKGTPLELDLDVSRVYNPCAVRLHVSIQLFQKLLSEKQASNQPEPGCWLRSLPLELLAHPGQVRAIKNKSDYLEHIGPRDNQELSMAEWAQPSLT